MKFSQIRKLQNACQIKRNIKIKTLKKVKATKQKQQMPRMGKTEDD